MTQEIKENDDLPTKVYELVNGIRDVPEIAAKLLGEDAKVGTKKFKLICEAVDKLIDEGLVYFRCADGVLLDLQR